MFSTFCSFPPPVPPSSSAHNNPAVRTGRNGKGGLGEAPRERRVVPRKGFHIESEKLQISSPSSPVVSPAAPPPSSPTCLETEQGNMGTLAPARPIDAGRISAPEAQRQRRNGPPCTKSPWVDGFPTEHPRPSKAILRGLASTPAESVQWPACPAALNIGMVSGNAGRWRRSGQGWRAEGR